MSSARRNLSLLEPAGFFGRSPQRANFAHKQAGYSSVGRASDCRNLQQSDGPWFDSGWPDFSTSSIAQGPDSHDADIFVATVPARREKAKSSQMQLVRKVFCLPRWSNRPPRLRGGKQSWTMKGGTSWLRQERSLHTIHVLRHSNAKSPYGLVVRTSRCGRDNPGSTPGVVILRCVTASQERAISTHEQLSSEAAWAWHGKQEHPRIP